MNDDDKLLELSKELSTEEIENAVSEMVAKAEHLQHNTRKDLVTSWESEREALRAITINYLNLCETDAKIQKNAHQAAVNSYTQAMMYGLAADKLKKGLCDPTKIPL